ncbi:APC family permease [Sciscionella sediminilitoris]|uniref:APC family permease n=1 Tax=Sciscionella sediminilitoris TaxID=1445613 RepID=UPI0004DF596D|nr:APC family permease [Sciscionella sp. SE31]
MATTQHGGEGGHKLRRDLGLVGLLFAGVGSLIGSGWLFGALKAAKLAGPAALLSWAIAAVMILFIGLCFAELGTMFPISGGVVRFPHIAFGSFASYVMGWITWLAAVSIPPVEVEAVLQYSTGYIQSLGLPAMMTPNQLEPGADPVYTLTGFGTIIAVILMAVFVLINYYGVKYFARINNALVWWKLLVIVVVIAAFLYFGFKLGHFSGNFTRYGFMPGGWEGVFTAIATAGIAFSFIGFRQGIELAGESKNPKRNVPIAVIGCVLICGVIYVLLQIAFVGVVQPGDLAKAGGWEHLSFANDFGPLAAIATILGLGWLAIILYIDAVVSPGDTGLIYNTVTARISYAMGQNGNAPQSLTKVSKRGVPVVSLLVTFVVGLIFFLPFPSWQSLVSLVTSATVLSFGSGPIVLAVLRRRAPGFPRPFKLAGGDIIPFLAFFSANMIVFWAGWDTNWKLFLMLLLGLILLPIFIATSKRKLPPLDFKAGAWVIPWLVLLAVISYLGDYGGGLKVLSLGWGALAMFVVSLGIYIFAIRSGLSPVRVEREIENARSEAAEEETAIGAE